MPSPSGSLATLRPDLAASLMEFDLEMDRRGFVAARVAPVIEVQKASGTYGIVPIEQLLQSRNLERASGAGYARGHWTFDDVTFATVEYGAEEPVDDRESKLYSNYFDAELIATMRAFDVVLRGQEKRVGDLIFNTTTWTGASLTTAIAAGKEWDNEINAVPIDDVEAAVVKVYDGTGLWPNALVVNRKTFRNLRNCDQVIERIAAQGAGSATKASDITAEMLARVFDLEFVLVAGASRNSANEGATATPVQIWDNDMAMVCKIAKTNDMREPCIARTFHWSEDGSQIGGTVESYREEQARADIIRVRHEVQEKVVYKECGHLITNVLA